MTTEREGRKSCLIVGSWDHDLMSYEIGGALNAAFAVHSLVRGWGGMVRPGAS